MSDQGRILVVDDEEMIRNVISSHLHKRGFSVQTCSDGLNAAQLVTASRFDVVLTDLQMPGLDGITLIRRLLQLDPSLPVIIVTSDSSFDLARQAVQIGAYDYIVKPFPLAQLDAAVHRAFERRRLINQNLDYQRLLEEKVREKTAHLLQANALVEQQAKQLRRTVGRLRSSFDETVTAMVNAIEARDSETRNHCRRARAYTQLIAMRMGLTSSELLNVGWGALLHDVGKIGVPDSILLKNGPLTPDEWLLMKRHPELGYQMVRNIEFLADASLVVLAHHEKWDGSGYPYGTSGEAIPIGARCFAVADAVEAITSRRAYKPALPIEHAYDQIEKGSGNHFDPDVVHAFLSIPPGEFERIRQEYLEHPDEVIAEAARARPTQFAGDRERERDPDRTDPITVSIGE